HSEEPVVHALLEYQAARCGATLPSRAERAPQHTLQREVEVGIIHDDLRVLAAHLERESLVHPATGLTHDSSGLGGAGEGDERNLGMLHDRLPDRLANAVHQLYDVRRQTRLEQYFH